MARSHHHHPAPASRRTGPGFSLMLLSAGQRLIGVLVLIAALWAAVAWAVL
jgi:hypothetical protein